MIPLVAAKKSYVTIVGKMGVQPIHPTYVLISLAHNRTPRDWISSTKLYFLVADSSLR